MAAYDKMTVTRRQLIGYNGVKDVLRTFLDEIKEICDGSFSFEPQCVNSSGDECP